MTHFVIIITKEGVRVKIICALSTCKSILPLELDDQVKADQVQLILLTVVYREKVVAPRAAEQRLGGALGLLAAPKSAETRDRNLECYLEC